MADVGANTANGVNHAGLLGLLLHQDGSTHQWVPGESWDLIVTMDDATNEHYSMFFVDEEGTRSGFQGAYDVIVQRGLFSVLYTDRSSHYWNTPKAGGKVDKENLTQFGSSMKRLGIQMIEAYSPEARGRSERAFGTHQRRLPNELALHRITDMDEANRYLNDIYLPAYNTELVHPACEDGSAFVPWIGGEITDYLREVFERTVTNDNCVKFETLCLQIPKDPQRYHYAKAVVSVRKHLNGTMSISYGPRELARYTHKGQLIEDDEHQAAA